LWTGAGAHATFLAGAGLAVAATLGSLALPVRRAA
jgi:hypothetical protein